MTAESGVWKVYDTAGKTLQTSSRGTWEINNRASTCPWKRMTTQTFLWSLPARSLVSKTAFFFPHPKCYKNPILPTHQSIQPCVSAAHKLNIKMLYIYFVENKQKKKKSQTFLKFNRLLQPKPVAHSRYKFTVHTVLSGFSTHFCSCHLYIVKKYIKYREILQVYSG